MDDHIEMLEERVDDLEKQIEELQKNTRASDEVIRELVDALNGIVMSARMSDCYDEFLHAEKVLAQARKHLQSEK